MLSIKSGYKIARSLSIFYRDKFHLFRKELADATPATKPAATYHTNEGTTKCCKFTISFVFVLGSGTVWAFRQTRFGVDDEILGFRCRWELDKLIICWKSQVSFRYTNWTTLRKSSSKLTDYSILMRDLGINTFQADIMRPQGHDFPTLKNINNLCDR